MLALALTACEIAGAYPAELASRARFWADSYGIEPELVLAVIEVESSWNPRAVSRAGAVGLMQLMPDTAFAFRVANRFDVEENLRGGVAHLAWLQRLYRGDRRLMMASYIAGQGYVLQRGLGWTYSDEVHRYVVRVAHLYRRNRWERLLEEGAMP